MLLSADGRVAISNLGWIDRGALHVIRTADGVSTSVRLSDAAYLKLRAIDGDRFLVQHGRGPRDEPDRLELAIHTFGEPATAVASASLHRDTSSFVGDERGWTGAPRWFVDYFRVGDSAGYRLFEIDPAGRTIVHQPLDWMNNDNYDLGYQGVVDVVGIPHDRRLIVSVQCSSTLVLHDPEKRKQVGSITLGDRGGNPRMSFLRTRPELWADDYDTLVRVDARTLQVRDRLLLQSPKGAMQQFVGEFAFDRAERRCVVARPFSADVAVVDVREFSFVRSIPVGGEPLQVVITDEGQVFTRDWHTGAVRAERAPA